MTRTIALTLILICSAPLVALEEAAQLRTMSGTIYGTLLVPEAKTPVPVVLLIAGSGPTDRNGNVGGANGNNALKMLAEALGSRGIASLRYDKRGIGESAKAMPSEADIRFDNYIDDAAAWVEQLRKDTRFSFVAIAGHSEGSLIGMIAAERGGVKRYISIAGAGVPAPAIIHEQLASKVPPALQEASDKVLASLSAGKTIDAPPELMALYRPSVQPYLISWFKYDPAKEIAKLRIPVLIVQGTTDIQVSVDQANALKKAKLDAKLAIIDGMNHVLKLVDRDQKSQSASYTSEPDRPIAPQLVDAIASFILGQKSAGS